VVYFAKANVVHLGDDYVTYGFPFMDLSAGGSVKGLVDGLTALMARLPPDVKVIAGHGPVGTQADVRAYLGMIQDTRAAVVNAVGRGQTLEQLKAVGVLDPWKKYSGNFISTDAWLETLVYEATGKAGAAAPRP
jgi:cyclase